MSYDKRLYEQAEQELDRRRLSAESRLDFNIAEAERKIPEIAEIRRQLSSTSIELSKLIIKRDGDFRRNFEKLKEQNLQGQAMIKQLLAKNGFPENYLEAQYSCQICRDKGYAGGERCVCYKELLNKLAVEKLNS
ncbi:MAG: DNA replication protein DnaC, partial [Oscillospiraceae bacterium]|nr:DNA replication protein DnaC [Oscillospiraceae bacterium]